MRSLIPWNHVSSGISSNTSHSWSNLRHFAYMFKTKFPRKFYGLEITLVHIRTTSPYFEIALVHIRTYSPYESDFILALVQLVHKNPTIKKQFHIRTGSFGPSNTHCQNAHWNCILFVFFLFIIYLCSLFNLIIITTITYKKNNIFIIILHKLWYSKIFLVANSPTNN